MKTSTTQLPELDCDFRRRLRSELAKRCHRNPRYSLRAFALHLGIDHATLSQIIKGKRTLTVRTIRALAAKLGIDASRTEDYVAYQQHVADPSQQDQPVTSSPADHQHATRTAPSWQHDAILELIRVHQFRTDSSWIAQVLDLSVDEVNVTLTQLLISGLVKMVDRTTWQLTTSSPPSVRVQEVLELQQRSEAISQRSADTSQQPIDRHYQSSSVMAIKKSRLPAAIHYLNQVHERLAEILGDEEPGTDDVYCFQLSLLPLTHLQDEERRNGTARLPVSDRGQTPGKSS